MTAGNLHPLANPFNTRRFGNFNISKMSSGSYYKSCKDPTKLHVPNSSSQQNVQQQQQRRPSPFNMLDAREYCGEWGKVPAVEEIIEEVSYHDGLSKSEREYQEFVKKKDAELFAAMSDEQRRLLMQLDSGQIMQMCKLEDDL